MKSASLQYATALADIVLEQGAAEPAQKQLDDFFAAYKDSAELRNFLSSPAIPREAAASGCWFIAPRSSTTGIDMPSMAPSIFMLAGMELRASGCDKWQSA